MNYRWISLIIMAFMIAVGFTDAFNQKNDWTQLFNGKNLSGWDTYLGPPLDDAGKKMSDIPVGLNKDPKQVFSVVDENGGKVIRISGESWGGISTRKEYENFHPQLKFKWGVLIVGTEKGKEKR